MSVLYICNSSSIDTITRCLQRMSSDDALLLIENAVIVLNSEHQGEALLEEASLLQSLFALQPDLTARAIHPSPKLAEIRCIDYDGFVQLTIEYHVTCYWK